MKKQIEITEETYQRMGALTVGFETPEDVIKRLMNYFEGQATSKGSSVPAPASKMVGIPPSHNLEIVFHPDDEEGFKTHFLDKKIAYIHLTLTNGETDHKEWECQKFTRSSSVKGNLLSGYLRHWRQKGIVKAEISTDKDDLPS